MKFFRLALVALALVASFAIVGCAQKETPATEGAAPAAGDAAPSAPAEAPK